MVSIIVDMMRPRTKKLHIHRRMNTIKYFIISSVLHNRPTVLNLAMTSIRCVFIAHRWKDVTRLCMSRKAWGNSIAMRDTKVANGKYRTIVDDLSVVCYVVGVDEARNRIYVYTNEDAPMGKLVAYDLKTLKPVKEILPEKDVILTGVLRSGKDNLIAMYEEDACSHAYLYDCDGKMINEIELPSSGTAAFSASSKNDDVFYSFYSFTNPGTLYIYDKKAGKSV